MTAHPDKIRSLEEIMVLYDRPLLDLVFEAAKTHRNHHAPGEVQLCTLLSIKTGGCTEDCKYCSQSVHNEAKVEREPLMNVDDVLTAARAARDSGSTRFCMGAATRGVKDGRGFNRVLDMVRGVKAMGLEACCTLGMLTEDQAKKLKEAGLTAYNHNLDTSEAHYASVVTTRTYQDRLDTIANVAKAGISLCCGGILGMGESREDRVSLLHTLASLDPQPESVPINALVPVEGTPLQDAPPLDVFEWIRTISVARILMPKAMVRLSAGRLSLSREAQALAVLAGANSIFTGEKLLTAPNPQWNDDAELMKALGLTPRPPEKDKEHEPVCRRSAAT
ncbi:MAG: biotin synthase BioB [Pseudomonadota bacterium]